jgi:diadenosine tetraphosphatase ApaH/serine/threonine PP2A family protein phosphatase
VWELLADPDAEEWRHKVGVAGPVDGSAKPTTRLLAARGWVCKTRTDQGFPSASAGREAVLAIRGTGRAAGIWHPDKLWAVMRIDDAWLPLTVCPELTTLRRLERFEDRVYAWTEMIQAAIDVYRLHRIGLDLNPANFARASAGARLYYIDDEVYDDLDARGVATAIIARIPEEPSATPASWERWGAVLRGSLAIGELSWEAIDDELRLYPLPERYDEPRHALLKGVADAAGSRPSRRTSARELTCVLADVHANLAALEAVLDDAREHGVDRFLFLGDAIGYGPDPGACVRRLAELPNTTLVRGNHDHAIATGRLDLGMNSLARECAAWTRAQLDAAELAWLGEMPIDHVADGWIAVHGAPKDPQRFLAYVYELTFEDNLRHLREQRIPLCFYGHTHVQLIHVELASGPSKLPGVRAVELSPRHYWLVNPGSVGQPRDGDPRAGYALWDRRTGQLASLRVPYDVERTAEALRNNALPHQLAQRLRAGA